MTCLKYETIASVNCSALYPLANLDSPELARRYRALQATEAAVTVYSLDRHFHIGHHAAIPQLSANDISQCLIM